MPLISLDVFTGLTPHRAVELSLPALLERIDDFLFERNALRFRHAAGLSTDAAEQKCFTDYPEFGRAEALQEVTELIDSPRTEEARKPRLKVLQAFLRRTLLEARAAELTDAVHTALETTRVASASKHWQLAEALRALPTQTSRQERNELERDIALCLTDLRTPLSRRVDVVLAATAEVKATSAEKFIELIHGRPLVGRIDALDTFLRDTGDAYRDVLTFALKRVDPALKPGHARLHDLERALHAPWLFEHFRREELLHAITRCLTDLGLHPNANGRIGIDSEPRPGRSPEAQAFELRVPDEIRLLFIAGMGFEPYATSFSAWGLAMHRALVAKNMHFVERRLGDPAVPQAMALVFESLLGDEAFLKRYLRVPSAPAREAARLFAFRQLTAQRRAAANTLMSIELLRRGPVLPLADDFEQRLSAALYVEVPKSRFLLDTDVFASDALTLDAWSLEQVLHTTLTARFNEDFWRNPAAGRWLSDFAAKGQRDEAVVVAKTLGAPSLDVRAAAARRIAVMGA